MLEDFRANALNTKGRRSRESLELLYKAADTAQAQGLTRISVTQQTIKNDNNGTEGLSRVKNGLKMDSKMI